MARRGFSVAGEERSPTASGAMLVERQPARELTLGSARFAHSRGPGRARQVPAAPRPRACYRCSPLLG
jgi:hypothetical protein